MNEYDVDDYEYDESNSLISGSIFRPKERVDCDIIKQALKHVEHFKVASLAELYAALKIASPSYENKKSSLIKSINSDFTEFDGKKTRIGYKTCEEGLYIWEGSFMSSEKGSLVPWQKCIDFYENLTSDELFDEGEQLSMFAFA